MTRAYEETYLDDAMENLGDMFDYATNDCNYNVENFFSYFIISGIADSFGKGNPRYVAGLTGPELASEVLFKTQRMRPTAFPNDNVDKSPEFWVGWILAYYQWYTAYRFSDMQRHGLTAERVLSLFPTLHEADVSKFVNVADGIIGKSSRNSATNLQRLRKTRNMTQKMLAEKSGATLRMVQLYEQRRQDINKAQASTIAGLARALGCRSEDLLEPTTAEGR